MHNQTKHIYWAILALAVMALFAAACTTAQQETQPAAPGSNSVPVTAPTGTTGPAASPTTAAAAPTATTAAGVTGADPTATAAATAATAATGSSGAGSSGAGSSGAVTYVLVPEQSSASYAVTEQLARRNLPNDAVGKTSAITGQVTINPDGSIDQANSKFTVDATTLQTDESMRDNYVRRNILQTSQYPTITFVPTQVTGLPSPLPASGDVKFQVTGDLTIRDVTKPVTWDVTGTLNNGEATGTATTSFTFGDFNLNQPQVPVVLSVVDKITLTANVTLKPQQ